MRWVEVQPGIWVGGLFTAWGGEIKGLAIKHGSLRFLGMIEDGNGETVGNARFSRKSAEDAVRVTILGFDPEAEFIERRVSCQT